MSHHLRPMLASIARRTEESTYLSIRANRDSVCIDLAEVGQGLSECRRLGFAFNNGRIVAEVAALGVAFRVPDSGHYVAISVASVVSRMHAERQQLVIEVIRDEIRQPVSQTADHLTF